MKPIRFLVIIIVFLLSAFCSKDPARYGIAPKIGPMRLIAPAWINDLAPDWRPNTLYVTSKGDFDQLFFYDTLIFQEEPDKKEFIAIGATPYESEDLATFISYHAWSNDFSNIKLAYVRDIERPYLGYDYELTVLDYTKSSERTVLYRTEEKELTWPSWTWDDSQVAFLSPQEDKAVFLVNADGGDVEAIPNTMGWGELKFARCGADGPYLIYISRYNGIMNIYRIGLSGGDPAPVTEFTDPSMIIYCAEMSPDGAYLAYSMKNTENPYIRIYLKDIGNGEPIPATPGVIDAEFKIYRNSILFAWSPDGSKIVVFAANETASTNLKLIDRMQLYPWALYIVPIKEEE